MANFEREKLTKQLLLETQKNLVMKLDTRTLLGIKKSSVRVWVRV